LLLLGLLRWPKQQAVITHCITIRHRQWTPTEWLLLVVACLLLLLLLLLLASTAGLW
jgi:hypothetical protein